MPKGLKCSSPRMAPLRSALPDVRGRILSFWMFFTLRTLPYGGGVPWDGFLILTWLRRIEEAKDTPVVFVTGANPALYEARSIKAGATAFFHKPYKTEELIELIRKEVGTKKVKALPRKRILFVDDEGDWRFMAGSCLEDAGFEVLTAKDAAGNFSAHGDGPPRRNRPRLEPCRTERPLAYGIT